MSDREARPALTSPTVRLAGEPATDPAGTVAAGDHLAGRYRVVRFVAAGGQGAVWEVVDEVLGAAIAIKVLRPELAAAPGMLDRLRREVLLAREVTHPNACRIFGLEVEPGPPPVHFVTMEMLRGETLAARVARGPVPPAEVARLTAQIAAALEVAHRAGVVHRDLKTANILLVERDGVARAVVTDFGLAAPFDAPSARPEGASPGTGIAGTPAYMAPEQLAGGALGPAVDVWALGVVIFELLTGELPHGELASIDAARAAIARPSRRLADVAAGAALGADAAGWQAVIDRCLAPRPEDRFADVAAVTAALPAPARAPGRRPRRGWILALALVAAAAGAGAWRLTRPSATGARPAARAADRASADPVAARAALRAHVQATPGDSVARAHLAGALLALGEDRAARAQLGDVRTSTAGLPRADALLIEARGHEVDGAWDAAVASWQVLTSYPADDPFAARYGLLGALLEAGRALAAERTLADLRASGAAGPQLELAAARVAFLAGDYARQADRGGVAEAAAAELPGLAVLAGIERADGLARLGQLDEALAALAQLEPRAAALDAPGLRGKVLLKRAQVLWRRGQPDGARAILVEAGALFDQVGDASGTGAAETSLGLLLSPSDATTSLPHFERATAAYRAAGDELGVANAALNLATAQLRLGQLELAARTLDGSIEIARRRGDATITAIATINLAEIHRLAGRRVEAAATFADVRAQFAAMPYPAGVVNADSGLGAVARLAGDLDAAARHLDAAAAGLDTGEEAAVLAIAERALVHAARGQPAAARRDAADAAQRLGAIGVDAEVYARDVEARVAMLAGDRAAARAAARHAARLAGSPSPLVAWTARVVAARAADDAPAALAALAAEARAGGFGGLADWAGLP